MVLTTLTAAFSNAIVQVRFISGDIQVTVGTCDDARGSEAPLLNTYSCLDATPTSVRVLDGDAFQK